MFQSLHPSYSAGALLAKCNSLVILTQATETRCRKSVLNEQDQCNTYKRLKSMTEVIGTGVWKPVTLASLIQTNANNTQTYRIMKTGRVRE